MAIDFQKLISLLDSPRELSIAIESLRANEDLDESIRGFIAMYDQFKGDTLAMKLQMSRNKITISNSFQKTRKRSKIIQLLAYAATIVLCFGLYFFLENNDKEISISSVYKDPGLPNYMSDSNRNGLELIMFYYLKDDYTTAIRLTDKQILRTGSNDTLIYYRSLFSYLSHHDQNAMAGFQSINNSTSVYRDRASYFQAILYIKKNKIRKARLILQKLCNSSDQSIASFSSKHLIQLKANQ